MKGIKMSNCRFYVDEEARTVICVVPNTKTMVVDYIEENFNFNDISLADFGYSRSVFKSLLMPNSFTGKAVCAAEDPWNEEAGKLLAYSRAKDKCYKSFFRRANYFVQLIDARLGDMVEHFNNFGIKLANNTKRVEDKLTTLIPKDEDEEEDE